RVAINACADRREGNRAQAVFFHQGKTAPVAAGQEFSLIGSPPFPDGAHGMDDMAGGKAVAPGALGIPRPATPHGGTFPQHPRPGRLMDRPIDTAATHQGRVGRIDDGINLLLGNIAFHEVESVTHGWAPGKSIGVERRAFPVAHSSSARGSRTTSPFSVW